MAQYTLTIKQLKENNVPLFNFNYPIFNEEYRSVLEEKITRHFYFREIGFETVGRFLYELETKLNEIMPFYNKLYESTLFEFNPLINYQVKEVQSRDIVANGKTVESGGNKNLFSDTPQGRINFDDKTHATSLSQDEINVNVVNNGLTNETFTRTMEGNIGVQTFSQLLTDYRETFINVDMMVMDELNELFMRVY